MGSGFSKQKKAFKEAMAAMQADLKTKSVTGSSGNGLVTITLNGEHQVQSLKIKPECVDPEDLEGLEILIKAAFNDAASQLKESNLPSLPGMGNMLG